MILVGSSALMSPSCCTSNNSAIAYTSGWLILPFPSNNFNSSIDPLTQPFCTLISEPIGFPFPLINVGSSSGYDISVEIYGEPEGGVPGSGCFIRKYETSNYTMNSAGGSLTVEYPNAEPYYIKIVVAQKCSGNCVLNNNKKRLILQKRVTNGLLPNYITMQQENWQNSYVYSQVTCSTPNLEN